MLFSYRVVMVGDVLRRKAAGLLASMRRARLRAGHHFLREPGTPA